MDGAVGKTVDLSKTASASTLAIELPIGGFQSAGQNLKIKSTMLDV